MGIIIKSFLITCLIFAILGIIQVVVDKISKRQ